MLNSQSSIKQTQSQQIKKSTELQSIHKLSLTSPIYDPELDYHGFKGSQQMKGSLCTTLSQPSHHKESQLYQQLREEERQLKKEKYLLTKQHHQEYQTLLKELMELRRLSYARKTQIQQLVRGVAKAKNKKISLTISHGNQG